MRLRLQSAQVLILVGVLLFVVAVVGASAHVNASFAVDDLGSKVLAQAADRVDQQVQTVLEVAVGQGRLNERLLETGRIDPHDHVEMTAYFLEALRAHESLSYITFGLANGEYWHVFRDAAGAITTQRLIIHDDGSRDLVDSRPSETGLVEVARDEDTSRVPPYERPYYRSAAEAGVAIWPETYVFLSAGGAFDIPGVSRASPVTNAAGELVGVLTVDFDLYALSRYLERVKVGDAGVAFLLEMRQDGEVRLIAHPDAPEPLKLTAPGPEGQGSAALPASEIADARVRAFLDHLPASAGAMGSGVTPVAFTADGTRFVGGYRRLSGDDRPAWVIAMVLPEAEIVGGVERMNRITVAAAMVGVLLALLIGLRLSRRVAGRLHAIATETSEVAEFRLDAKPVVHSRIEELDSLGVAVEDMKAGLRSFQKFVPHELVRSILASGEEARLGGARRGLTVYFSDIVSFTRIAEQLEPEPLVELLAEYLDAMTHGLLETDATVDKYVGDAIMAFWGAPDACEDQAARACRAALLNQRVLAGLRETWSAAGRPQLHARIGLHTGEAIVGNFGSEQRLAFTAIGDTVNLASRLEGLNTTYGTSILISEATRVAAGEAFVTRPIDRVAVKGRDEETLVHELIGEGDSVSVATREWVAVYSAALTSLFAGEPDEARARFTDALRLEPDDQAARVMLARLP